MGFLDWVFGRSGTGDARPRAVHLAGQAGYVVLDTELTGLDPRKDDIVSIGAIRMAGGRIELGQTFHELVRPRTALDGRSVVIHGITPSQVAGKPSIDEVLPDFLRFCGGDILVGHCLSIDLSFLNREARRLSGAPFRNPVVDTLSLYGWLRHHRAENPIFSVPLNGNLRLFDMAKAFGIPVRGAHDALADAFITAQLFQRFLPILDVHGVRDTEDLLRVGDPGLQGENFLGPAGGAGF